jgi:hypothetical protein
MARSSHIRSWGNPGFVRTIPEARVPARIAKARFWGRWGVLLQVLAGLVMMIVAAFGVSWFNSRGHELHAAVAAAVLVLLFKFMLFIRSKSG